LQRKLGSSLFEGSLLLVEVKADFNTDPLSELTHVNFFKLIRLVDSNLDEPALDHENDHGHNVEVKD
jgi:hypothetical protein